MKQEEFISLIDKYNRGECNAQEQEIVFEFCNQLNINGTLPNWDLNEEEQTKIKVLTSLNAKIDRLEIARIKTPKRRIPSVRMIWRVAAIVLVVAVFGFWFSRSEKTEPAVQLITKTTSRGQKLTVSLADGTKVKLNSESTITYPLTFENSGTREISLSGEAFFTVTEDKKKPFIVHTDQLDAVVLGTSFNINAYQHNSRISITLETGKVRVETNQLSGLNRSFEILPGEQVSFIRSSREMHKQKIELSQFISWKDGTINLEDKTIQEAINILERWYNISFSLGDSKIEGCKLSGEFNSDNLENILRNMEFLTNLKFQLVNGTKVIVTGSCG